ncbi:MAG: hypothetical protein HC812_05365 [Leptolyngbya sp. RL_3_1]|nr:hypothetical protein [Leptolyngbya sp. RL_3_1]
MAIVLLIFGLSLLPALVAVWFSLRAKRLSEGLGLAREAASGGGFRAMLERSRDLNYVEGLGYIVGDASCQMNARSPYLRCAFNPCGPCAGCDFYEAPTVRTVVQTVPTPITSCPLPEMPLSCPLPAFSVAA